MSASATTPRPREQIAERLLDSSAKHSYDPTVDIDWDAELADDLYFEPPHRASLYGTPLWESMTEGQRIELTKHEVASIAATGIWFETILMRLLLSHAYGYRHEPTSNHVQYALTEVGDECRHSVMFGDLIERLGCPGYGPRRHAHRLGRVFDRITNQAVAFAGTLYVEELLDALQREAAADESVQPLARRVSHIHVVEEARHKRYADEELARQLAHMSRTQCAYTRWLLVLVAKMATDELIHPRVYAAVGLDVEEARRQAAANPAFAETKRWAASKAVAKFDELGLLDGGVRRAWRRIGLL
jgi:hypothetical protein